MIEKKRKEKEPAPGFDDLVKKLLNTPPAPKKADERRKKRGTT